MDPRWDDIEALLINAERHFANAVALHEQGGFDAGGLAGYQAEMALMHALQSGHTSAESAMLRVLELLEEPIVEHGASWHETLIRRLSRSASGDFARPALWPPEIATELHETRRFRHRVVHAYEDFEVAQVGRSVEAAHKLSRSLCPALRRFAQALE